MVRTILRINILIIKFLNESNVYVVLTYKKKLSKVN